MVMLHRHGRIPPDRWLSTSWTALGPASRSGTFATEIIEFFGLAWCVLCISGGCSRYAHFIWPADGRSFVRRSQRVRLVNKIN